MRRYNDSRFLPTSSRRYERGGATLAMVFAQNIEGVSRTLTCSAILWRPWMYVDLIFADNFYAVFQSSSRTAGAIIGAAEYVAQHANLGSGIQTYINHASGVLWQQTGVQIYDTTSWAAEFFIITGSDVTTLQVIWCSGNSGNTSYVQCQITGGRITVTHPGGTVTGPVVAANTTYHVIVNMASTAMGIYLNDVATTGTGTVPVAQAIGTSPVITIGTTNPSPLVPFLGSIGFVTFTKAALSQTMIDNHYNSYAFASFLETVFTQTIAANAAFSTMMGRGGTYPLPEDFQLSTVGEMIVTLQMES